MRFLLPWLVLASCATAFDTAACSIAPGYVREPAFSEYDPLYAQWITSVGQRLATDADPEIAWAGAILAEVDAPQGSAKPALPMPPTTGLGRLLRAIYCDESNRCPTALDEWIAAEPDNTFVRAFAREELGEEAAYKSHGGIGAATRYDDYFLASRALSEKLVRLAGEPPPAPDRYQPPPCSFMHGTEVAERIDKLMALVSLQLSDDFENDDGLDDATRLHLANVLVAAKGSPTAAQTGAELGVAVATAPIDRERYCRLNERATLLGDVDAIGWLMIDRNADHLGHRRRFLDALRTRNALDAVDAIASRLPANRRPDPVDPERVAACVAGRD